MKLVEGEGVDWFGNKTYLSYNTLCTLFIGSNTVQRVILTAAIVIITSGLAASKCAPWMYYLDIYGAHSWTPHWGQIQPLRPMETRGQFEDGGKNPIGYDSRDEKTWQPGLGER